MATASQPHCQHELDLCGLDCPLPILRTKQALRDMAVGERVRVHATDPHAVIDFQGFCDTTSHRLLSKTQDQAVYTFCIERGP